MQQPDAGREELIETLADYEHASWANWMAYLFIKCSTLGPGSKALVIPTELVIRWNRQIETAYPELTEQEKKSDRKEVAHIMPAIEAYAKQTAIRELENLHGYDETKGVLSTADMLMQRDEAINRLKGEERNG